MNGLLKDFSFARAYIDDVIVFSDTLEEHLKHFNEIFALFDKWQITLKISKTYLSFFSISLLSQKIDNFELTTTKKKFKVITDLSFPKTFKELEIYLKMTGYFRDYVSYYVQKSEALNKKKTGLLKGDLMKKSTRKNFSFKTLMKNSSAEELNSYEQLKTIFSRFN